MKADLSDRLKAKGWEAKEIRRVKRVFKKAQENKSKRVKVLGEFIYWFVLLIAIFGNLVVSIALVPFLLELNNVLLYAVIVLLALVFGALFDLLIRDIEALEGKHIIVAGIFIPLLAVMNIFYVTKFVNFVSDKWSLGVNHNPWIIAVLYVGAFVLPHVLSYVFVKDVGY